MWAMVTGQKAKRTTRAYADPRNHAMTVVPGKTRVAQQSVARKRQEIWAVGC